MGKKGEGGAGREEKGVRWGESGGGVGGRNLRRSLLFCCFWAACVFVPQRARATLRAHDGAGSGGGWGRQDRVLSVRRGKPAEAPEEGR